MAEAAVVHAVSSIDYHSVILVVVAIFSVLTTIIVLLMKIGISKTLKELESVWDAISVLRNNQSTLRAELPRDYLRVDGPGYDALHDGITRIETAFNLFAKDCRDGKCGGKKS